MSDAAKADDGLALRLELSRERQGYGPHNRPTVQDRRRGPLGKDRPGRREQLEQRSASEQVQIIGEDVLRITKPLALTAGPDPAVLQTRQRSLIVGAPTRGSPQSADIG